jgi:hypothetical protein
MAPKYHPTPLSGGDRKALSKELGNSRAMANILATPRFRCDCYSRRSAKHRLTTLTRLRNLILFVVVLAGSDLVSGMQTVSAFLEPFSTECVARKIGPYRVY